jgi:hypothetical protein
MSEITRREFVTTTAALAGAAMLGPLADTLGTSAEAAPAIPLRPFGKTGVQVTMIGLGGGSRFYLPVPDDEQGAEIVRRTIQRGIRFIETSANYGPPGDGDQSERRIGLAMKTHRSQVFLETKTDERDYDGAMREMERSLQLLNTDHIDLMLHHYVLNAQQMEKLSGKGGAEEAIRKMVDQKVVRFRGFSCHVPALTVDGIKRLEPDAVQLIVNATRVPDYETEVLPLAKERGVAVVVMKAVGKGYFLPRNFTTPDRIEQSGPPPGVFEQHKNLPTAKEYLWYSLSLPVSTVVVGMDCMQTLDAVARDVAGFKPLTVAEMQAISDRAQPLRTTGFWLPRRT